MTQRNTLYWFKYILLSSSSLPCYIALTHTNVLTIRYNMAKPEPSENSIGRALKGHLVHILDLNQDQEYLNHSEMRVWPLTSPKGPALPQTVYPFASQLTTRKLILLFNLNSPHCSVSHNEEKQSGMLNSTYIGWSSKHERLAENFPLNSVGKLHLMSLKQS